jgi:3-deoxy-D-manno-octulosonic-acid transferase
MRAFYLFLSYILAPLVVPILIWKALRNPAYLDRWEERFGFGRSRTERRSIWIHAVSVGEVVAASPMVRQLKDRLPGVPVVISTVTPTGAQRVHDIFGDEVIHSYIPYDMPGAVKRFFDRFRPRLAIIMETEIWPNLYEECGRRGVPLVLANARVSPRSVGKYRRFVGLFAKTLSHGIVLAAQSPRDAERFRLIGASAERTHVVGNIKFDVEIPSSVAEAGRRFRVDNAGQRPVWIAASTHEGEEEIVLEVHRRLRQRFTDLLLILVPRHPQRFDAVAQSVERLGMACVRRSSGAICGDETVVFLGDTLGELTLFYAAADAAFVGGSLVPVGGHNLLEPAAMALPIVTGPHNFNAEDIAEMLEDVGAVRVARDSTELFDELATSLSDPALSRQRGLAGRRVLDENRGALDRLMTLVIPLMTSVRDSTAQQSAAG